MKLDAMFRKFQAILQLFRCKCEQDTAFPAKQAKSFSFS